MKVHIYKINELGNYEVIIFQKVYFPTKILIPKSSEVCSFVPRFSKLSVHQITAEAFIKCRPSDCIPDDLIQWSEVRLKISHLNRKKLPNH